MAEVIKITCLLRVGDSVQKCKIVMLDRNEVTIGRNREVTYVISSNMISRHHAVIKHLEDNTWSITDNKVEGISWIFNPGHVSVRCNEQAERLAATAPLSGELTYDKVEVVMALWDQVECAAAQTEDILDRLVHLGSLNGTFVNGQQLKPFTARTLQEGDLVQFGVPPSPDATAEFVYKFYSSLKVRIDKIGGKRLKLDSSACEDKETINASDSFDVEDSERKRKKACVKIVKEELDHERKEKERHAKEMEELRMKEQPILLEMQKKQVEETLQKEMEKAMEEKNKVLEQQLLNQKQKLEKVLELKDTEQKLLENQLNETKQENVIAELQVLTARQNILSKLVELMDMELQCAICNELFIEATSVNCTHVFCKFCINQWMLVKRECPTCRCPITSQWQAVALDRYIDEMVEQLNDEMKQERADCRSEKRFERPLDNGMPCPAFT